MEREDFWYRELCTVYPYGLNDNVRKVGNVSKLGPSTVVHALFNRQRKKFKKRQGKRHRSKVVREVMFEKVDSLLANYKSWFCPRWSAVVGPDYHTKLADHYASCSDN